MNRAKRGEHLRRGQDHIIEFRLIQTVQCEYPEISRRFGHLLGVKREPAAGLDIWLEGVLHVCWKEVFRELDLQRHSLLAAFVGDQQISSRVSRWNPDKVIRESALDAGTDQLLARMYGENGFHRFREE